ncbi:fumarylacetoacetate hydrolase family protein [Streptomyces sp. NPDC058614]|uniref:fumarylacetoacetate hydrolase family protein n=1 Tax=Streptomyces sp. NPDC058614 TaxID=3346557 RepID=UPI003648147A
MTFGLGTFSAADGVPFPGLVVEGRVYDLRPDFSDTLSMLNDWDTSLGRLRELAAALPGEGVALDGLRPLPPVASPQVLMGGANYYTHLEQLHAALLRKQGDQRSDEELFAEGRKFGRSRLDGEPFVFAGLPRALSGATDDVVLWGPGVQHDWELELAVVIGRGGRDIDVKDALDHVAGYTISNDISTRDVMSRPDAGMADYLMSKVRPTFFPTGPYFVPREFVPDYRKLRIQLKVNGELMQDESTDDMIFGVEHLIAHASKILELQAGDLLLTGSPAGNAGHHGNRWLVPGDVLESGITGLGVQRNRCVAPE